MAFDDLDQAEQEGAAVDEPESPTTGAADSADATSTDTTATTAETTPADSPEETPTDRAANSDQTTDAVSSQPAFGFEEATQRPLYARQSAWDEFEDALAIDVETTLRRNDVRDAPKREIHDAALRVLAEHADEVADRVLEGRGIDR